MTFALVEAAKNIRSVAESNLGGFMVELEQSKLEIKDLEAKILELRDYL